MDPAVPAAARADGRETGRTFPADEVVWGFVARPGFDELDDPHYHRGTTQHAYLEGNDLVALCGFRPPRSGPRTRRRSRLGLPTAGSNPMCGMCARKVVAPRPRIAVPVAPGRPAVAVPVAGQPAVAGIPVGAPAMAAFAQPHVGAPSQAPVGMRPPGPGQVQSPWVRRADSAGQAAGHGLMSRGVHADLER
jgi:hypothetical protein